MSSNEPHETHLAAAGAPAPLPASWRPAWLMRRVVDPLTRLLVGRLGLDDHNGTRILEVRGRTSGIWRATPVRVLELDGQRYLVALYGATGWVRNLRAQGGGRLRLGRQVTSFRAVELDDQAKVPVLRAYLKRWWRLVARLTPISSPDAPDAELSRVASQYPVFQLE
jgi:deazaflavin-dependent oxidoreductase (nitroreductase family)